MRPPVYLSRDIPFSMIHPILLLASFRVTSANWKIFPVLLHVIFLISSEQSTPSSQKKKSSSDGDFLVSERREEEKFFAKQWSERFFYTIFLMLAREMRAKWKKASDEGNVEQRRMKIVEKESAKNGRWMAWQWAGSGGPQQLSTAHTRTASPAPSESIICWFFTSFLSTLYIFFFKKRKPTNSSAIRIAQAENFLPLIVVFSLSRNTGSRARSEGWKKGGKKHTAQQRRWMATTIRSFSAFALLFLIKNIVLRRKMSFFSNVFIIAAKKLLSTKMGSNFFLLHSLLLPRFCQRQPPVGGGKKTH